MTSREKKMAAATGLAALAFLMTALVVDPLSQSFNLDAKIKISAHKLAKYRRLMQKKSAAKTPRVSENSSASGPFFELERLAAQSGVRILEVRPESRPERKGETTIGLRTEAQEEGYIRFLYELERSSFRLMRLQLTARPSTQDLEGAFSVVSVP